MAMNKKGADNNFIMVLIVVVAALFLFSGGNFNIPTGTTTPTTSPGVTTVNVASCSDEDQTLVLGPASRKGQLTSVTTEYHDWYINGRRQIIAADGSTQTVTLGDKITIDYAINSSRAYASRQEFAVSCGRQTASDPKLDPLGRSQLIFNTTWTVAVFNPSNKNQNAAGDNESITDGEVNKFAIELDGGASFEGWAPFALTEGDKKGWIVSADMNQTDFQEGETKVLLGGQTQPVATTPAGHPSPGSGFTTKSFYIKQVCDLSTSDTCEINFDLQVTGETGINPGPDTGANLASINVSFYDTDWARDPFDPHLATYGVEDSNSNISGQHASINRQVTAILYR